MKNANNIPPKLPEKPEKNAFCVPDGYFDNFAYNMQLKLSEKATTQNKIFFFFKPSSFLVYASMVLVITTASWLYFTKYNKLSKTLSVDEIAYYTEMNGFDFDEYLLMDEFADYYSTDNNQYIDPNYITEEDVLEVLNEK